MVLLLRIMAISLSRHPFNIPNLIVGQLTSHSPSCLVLRDSQAIEIEGKDPN